MNAEDKVTRLTASKLRQDIYNTLDRILETGNPVEIVRKGKVLRISPVDGSRRLSRLPKRPYLLGDPEEIVEMDWSDEWMP